MRKEPVVAGLLMLGLLIGACGSGDGAAPSATNADPSSTCDAATATDESDLPVATVAMADLTYLPGCFIVRSRGQILRIKNADHTTHTFTVDGTDVDVELPAGTNAKTTGDLADAGLVPGTYPFHCRIHTSMTGVVIVR
jgi:plastocyanin